MKLTCLQENLNHGLSISKVVVVKNATLPIVNNFLLEAKDGHLIIIATNLEIGIKTIVRGKVEKNGAITIPAAILTNFISNLPNKKVDLVLDGSNLKITCDKYKSVLNGIGADDFPLIPKTQQEKSIFVDANSLKIGLSQVINAVSTSEVRPELAGVFVKVEGSKMTLAATDSFKLAEKIIDLGKDYKIDYNIILPSKTAHELIRILEQEEKAQIFKDQNQVLFKVGSTELISRLVEAEFPDYPQIIPKEFMVKIVVNKQELLKNIKIAGIFANTRVNDIRMLLKDKNLQIKSNTPEVGENISECEIIKVEGEKIKEEITYNYHNLLDGLNNIYSDKVVMELNGTSDPMILRPADDNSYLYIMRPLKVV